ncbi:hypothetical protein ACFXCZ_32070 [Streptomyces sp. NPDC059396]|uniref:hypothetical protein n=1 Tax=Streptomyces sp. NPDC059396 TaxID=3346819 RepID=UPI0036A8988E
MWNSARLEAALEAFGRAVNAATAPQLSWWARRREVLAGRLPTRAVDVRTARARS